MSPKDSPHVALVVYVAMAVLVTLVVELAARRRRMAARASAEAAVMTTMAGAVLGGRGELPRLLGMVRGDVPVGGGEPVRTLWGDSAGWEWLVRGCSFGDPGRPAGATAEAARARRRS